MFDVSRIVQTDPFPPAKPLLQTLFKREKNGGEISYREHGCGERLI